MGAFRTTTTGLLLAIALTACGGASEKLSEKAIESATGADVDIDDDGETVKIETKDGTYEATSGDSAKMPADFPSGVPVPEGLKLTSTAKMGEVYTLGYEGSEAAVKKSCDNLRTAMKAAGFTEELWADSSGEISAGHSKGTMSTNYTCSPESGTISYFLTTEA